MYLTRILLDPAATAATGGISTGDINLSDPAFERLGLPQELRSKPLSNGPGGAQGQKPAAGTPPKKEEAAGGEKKEKPAQETAEQKEAREQAAQAATELAERAKAAGKTVEEVQAEEEAAATAEQERLEAKAAELGKTVEEVQTLEAEEAAANQPPELTPEATDYVQALVTEHEATLAAEKTRADQAEAEVQQLKNDLQTHQRPPLAVLGIDPIFLAASEADIAAREADMAAFEKWALANWDGVAETVATATTPGHPAYTAEQVRRRYAEVTEQRKQLVPKARQALQVRGEWEKAAKDLYPALFDSKRPESRVIAGYLKSYPELGAIMPNFHVVAGDSILGESLRKVISNPKHKAFAAAQSLLSAAPELKGLLAVKAPPAGKPVFKLPPKPGAGKAPGAVPRPGAGQVSRGAAKPGSQKAPTGPSAKALSDLRKSGLSERDALTQMISGISLPTLAPSNAE